MFDASEISVPSWLTALLSEKFFNACIVHEDAKKNEKNVFCLDCCEGICPHCFKYHRSHRLLQIRRYVYHDVIRLMDAEKLIDCARVQSYKTNSAKVIFINQRPQTRRAQRASGNLCITCDRNLQEAFLYCSLSCKLRHILISESDLSMYLRECEFLTLSEPGLDEEGQMTPDSVMEPAGSVKTDCSSASDVPTGVISHCPNLVCAAAAEIVRKKRSIMVRPVCRSICDVAVSASASRRKGTPNRSPLY